MKSYLLPILKLVLPVAVIVWLWTRVQQYHPEALATLQNAEKRWSDLAFAFLLIFSATTISFVRWHLLIRGLQIPIRLRDTLQLGFLGYLLNFVSPGNVGGDLFKAVFIARQQSQQRTEAVATIVVDRLCGLYSLLIVALVGLLATDLSQLSVQVAVIARGTYLLVAVGTLGIGLLLAPGLADDLLTFLTRRIPRLGQAVARLLASLQLYRDQKPLMVLIGLISLLVHVMVAAGIYLGARGLYDTIPNLRQHLVISPLAVIAGALPIAPGGLGSFELAMTYLYDLVSPGQKGQGIIISLGYRLVTILVATVGMAFYLLHRHQWQAVLQETTADPIAIR